MIRIQPLGKYVSTGVLVLSASLAFAAQDHTTIPSPQKANDTGSFYMQQLNESSDMMAQVDLAKRALDLGLGKDAVYHLNQATKYATELKKKSPEMITASTLRYNNKVFTFNNKYKDYLIPAVDDLFTVSDYNTKINRNPKKDKAAEEDTGIGRYQLALDIRNVESALNKSKQLATKGDVMLARHELNNLYKGAVENSMVYEDPIWAVNDNLMMTRALINEKDFDGARYALKKAAEELSTIKKADKYKGDAKTLATLESDINSLQQTIKKDDPGIVTKIGEKISHLLSKVQDIGKKHASNKASLPTKQ